MRCIAFHFDESAGDRKFNAWPDAPALAVRPILCM